MNEDEFRDLLGVGKTHTASSIRKAEARRGFGLSVKQRSLWRRRLPSLWTRRRG